MNNQQESEKKEIPSPRLSRTAKILFGLLLTLFVGSVGFLFGYTTPRTINPNQLPSIINRTFFESGSNGKIDTSIFETVWNTIQTTYLHKSSINVTDEYYGILKGLVASLGDPHSAFFDPEQTEEYSNGLSGSFEGIGAELTVEDGVLTIVTPLKGSPAEKAGLQSNDVITKINGEMTDSLDLDSAILKIRGKEGTTVVLTIVRGDQAPKDYTLTREKITVASVHLAIEDGVAIITLTSFTEDTMKQLDSAVQEMLLKNPQGVILDLRNNPGGLLDVSVEVANVFLPKDSVVVIERSGDGSETTHTTPLDGKLQNTPMIVLVNEGSASAAEIVAGALKDQGRVTLMGAKTFGKGTVQTYEVLPDGSSLKLTVAEWFTPHNESFDGKGIEPDVVVEMTNEDYTNGKDPQMDRAKEDFR